MFDFPFATYKNIFGHFPIYFYRDFNQTPFSNTLANRHLGFVWMEMGKKVKGKNVKGMKVDRK